MELRSNKSLLRLTHTSHDIKGARRNDSVVDGVSGAQTEQDIVRIVTMRIKM